MDDETFQEWQEQFLHRIDTINESISRLEGRINATTHQLKSIEYKLEEINRFLFSAVPVWLLITLVGWVIGKWTGNEYAVFFIWALLSVLAFVFLFLRVLLMDVRIWLRASFAKPGAFEFKVGDRVSVHLGGFGFPPTGWRGVVVKDEWDDPKVVRVKWYNGEERTYHGRDIYNLDKVANPKP
jgi:hypothetical protein